MCGNIPTSTDQCPMSNIHHTMEIPAQSLSFTHSLHHKITINSSLCRKCPLLIKGPFPVRRVSISEQEEADHNHILWQIPSFRHHTAGHHKEVKILNMILLSSHIPSLYGDDMGLIWAVVRRLFLKVTIAKYNISTLVIVLHEMFPCCVLTMYFMVAWKCCIMTIKGFELWQNPTKQDLWSLGSFVGARLGRAPWLHPSTVQAPSLLGIAQCFFGHRRKNHFANGRGAAPQISCEVGFLEFLVLGFFSAVEFAFLLPLPFESGMMQSVPREEGGELQSDNDKSVAEYIEQHQLDTLQFLKQSEWRWRIIRGRVRYFASGIKYHFTVSEYKLNRCFKV